MLLSNLCHPSTLEFEYASRQAVIRYVDLGSSSPGHDPDASTYRVYDNLICIVR